MKIKRDFVLNPSLKLYLPLWKVDGTSIRSEDAYGTSCTVTGALWTPWGRYFDGSDDRIAIGSPWAFSLANVSAYTIIAWVRTTDITHDGAIYMERSTSTNVPVAGLFMESSYLNFFHRDDANTATSSMYGVATIANNNWYHIMAVRYATARWELFINMQSKCTSTASIGTTTINNCDVGRSVGQTPSLTWLDLIREVRIYHGALTPQEGLRDMLETSRRYT